MRQYQESVLNYLCSRKPYPTQEQKEKIANMLEIEYTRVDKWLKNKHIKNKVTPKSQTAHIPSGELKPRVSEC